MDADDVMEVESGFRLPELALDAYNITVREGSSVNRRSALVSTRLPWRYIGVLHEYLDCGTRCTLGTVEGACIRIVGGGGRSMGKSVRGKVSARCRDPRVRPDQGARQHPLRLLRRPELVQRS